MKRKEQTLNLVTLICCAAALGPLSSALAQTGAPVQWGSNVGGVTDGLPGGVFMTVSAGYRHNLALRPDGSLVQWGETFLGQANNMPTGTFTTVAAGRDHCLALRPDGTLAQWGSTFEGQANNMPTGTFTAIAAGDDHNIALRPDGTLVQWGDARFGQANNMPTGTFTAIAAGGYHNLALRQDGTLVQWGDTSGGQANNLPTGTFVAIEGGETHCLALRPDGTLVQWGRTSEGQADNTPTTGTFTAIAAGYFHNLALRPEGTLVQWGRTSDGQATNLPAGTFTAIAAGRSHSLALRSTGLPLTSAFTYQGRLNQSGAPVNSSTDLTFALFTAPAGGSQIGTTLALSGVPVAGGLFTVPLDFGAGTLDGSRRWLEITANGQALTPRQELTAAPYASFATTAHYASYAAYAGSTGPDWTLNGTDLSYTGGYVGIGTATPLGPLDVRSGTDSYFLIDSSFGDIHANGGADGVFAIFNEGVSTGRTSIVTNNIEQFTVLNNGNVGIGTNSPTQALHVVGNIQATGDVGAACGLLTCSDARFKTNVEALADALQKVEKLRPVAFDWKRKEYPDRRFGDKRQIGFIAQEVENVLPEVVSKGSDGTYSVDYGRVTPLLAAAIRELKDQLDQDHRQFAERDRQIAVQAEQIQQQQHEIESLQDSIKSLKEIERRLAHLEAIVRQSATVQVASKEGAK